MQFKQGEKVRLISPQNEITYPEIRILSKRNVGVLIVDTMVLFDSSKGTPLFEGYSDWRIEEIKTETNG